MVMWLSFLLTLLPYMYKLPCLDNLGTTMHTIVSPLTAPPVGCWEEYIHVLYLNLLGGDILSVSALSGMASLYDTPEVLWQVTEM